MGANKIGMEADITIITFDLETQSYADLRKVGAHAYSEDPTTAVICACWGIDDGPIHEWWPAKGSTPELREMLQLVEAGAALVEAHNVAFEYSIWENVLAPRHGWPMPRDDQWRDSMAVAAYYAMPQALDKLCRALKIEGKDPDGDRLITKYSKLHLKTAQRRIPDGSDEDWVAWSKMTKKEQEEFPDARNDSGFYRDDFSKFVEYCRRDVLLEQTVSDELGDLPEREQMLWQLDFEINRRGLKLDGPGIEAATAVVDQRAEELTKDFRELTGGLNPTQRDKVLQWFRDNDLDFENLQKGYLEDALDEWDIPQGPARRALEIRLAISKASTKKLDAMARQASADGRARFQTRYHGAVTGRDTGGGFQPLNLVRSWEHVEPDQLVRDIVAYRNPRWLDCLYGDATEAVSKAGRHWITAAPGNEICAGDFVSVEAVVLACLAGQEWKVDAFREGKKIYELMGDKIHSLPEGTVTKDTHPTERQDGKTGELAFGYQGALNAWLKFDNSGRHTDERIIEICKAWRAEHPMIKNSWYGSEAAMLEAAQYPGRKTNYRDLGFEMVDEWLTMILPDGKRLWYRDPQVRQTWPQWHQPRVKEACALKECNCEKRPQVSYMAQKNGGWRRVYTYGGKIMENATQAVSRQLLTYAQERLDRYSYKIILKVYDELVTENPIGFAVKADFEELMQHPLPAFAETWPIRADAWIGERYRK